MECLWLQLAHLLPCVPIPLCFILFLVALRRSDALADISGTEKGVTVKTRLRSQNTGRLWGSGFE